VVVSKLVFFAGAVVLSKSVVVAVMAASTLDIASGGEFVVSKVVVASLTTVVVSKEVLVSAVVAVVVFTAIVTSNVAGKLWFRRLLLLCPIQWLFLN
jgi:hydrogenase maturation factor HypE